MGYVDKYCESILRYRSIVFDQEFQVFDRLELAAFEEARMGLRVPNEILCRNLSDLRIAMMQELDQLGLSGANSLEEYGYNAYVFKILGVRHGCVVGFCPWP